MFRVLKTAVLTIGFVGLLLPTGALADEALKDDGSHVAITAPKDGDMVGQTFDLKYDLHAGSQAHHAHVYLDGKYQKGFKGTFANVAPGKHEIKVQAANKDHKLLPAVSVVHVEVK
jgi:hypothetical protein